MKHLAYSVLAFMLVLTSCSGNSGSGSRADSDTPVTEAGVAEPFADSMAPDTADATSSAVLASGKNAVERLPRMIDFSATWCGPCRMIAPVIHELEEKYKGKVAFEMVDIDQDEAKAAEYGVEAVPTFVFLDSEGKEITRIVGADADGVKKALSELASK